MAMAIALVPLLRQFCPAATGQVTSTLLSVCCPQEGAVPMGKMEVNADQSEDMLRPMRSLLSLLVAKG